MPGQEGVTEIDESQLIPVSIPSGPLSDTPTSPTFVRDLSVDELEKLIEACVRRVIQGEDIKRELEKLKAATKFRKE